MREHVWKGGRVSNRAQGGAPNSSMGLRIQQHQQQHVNNNNINKVDSAIARREREIYWLVIPGKPDVEYIYMNNFMVREIHSMQEYSSENRGRIERAPIF